MSVVLPPHPLSYEGQTTLPYISKPFPPPNQFMQAPVPCLWNDTAGKDAYVQTYPGTWVPIGGLPGQVNTLTGNSGGAVSPDSDQNINILGTSGEISVTGSPGTNTLTLSLVGGSEAVDSFLTDDANTVLPTAAGLVTVTGGGSTATTAIGGILSSGATSNTIELQTTFAKYTDPNLQLFQPTQTTRFINLSSNTMLTNYYTIANITSRPGSDNSPVSIEVNNTSTSDATAGAAIGAVTATSGGDAYAYFEGGSAARTWQLGLQASTNQFQLQYNPTFATGNMTGQSTFLQIDTSGNTTISAGDLTTSHSTATGGPQLIVSNSNNGASANARIVIASAGAGDLFTLLDSPLQQPGSWEYGLKASSNNFEIQAAPANTTSGFMDGTAVFRVTQTGIITLFKGQIVNVTIPGAYPYQVLVTDYFISVDTSVARTITLTATPATGQTFRIKDVVGSAAANNITVQGNGSNINGAASFTMNSNYQSIDVVYTGTIWAVV